MKSSGSQHSLPPGPALPRFLQLFHWVFRPIPFMEECRSRYGDWFTLRLRKRLTFVFTSDPEAIRQVFAGDPHQLRAGAANVVLKPLLGEHSLLLLDGDSHAEERKLMMPPFHGERMHAYGEIMRKVSDRSLQCWPEQEPFPIHPKMQAITLDVILKTVLGLSENETYRRLHELLTRLLSITTRPLRLLMVGPGGEVRYSGFQSALGRFSPWGQAVQIMREVDKILFAEIARRRKLTEEGREDVLTMLIGARDEDGRAMTDQELRDEMMTLLVAGHETTATALSWVFCRLVEHSHVLEKTVAEIEQAQAGGPISPKQVTELRYLDSVVKETLRLNPIVPVVGRCLQAPLEIAGRVLPAGVIVAPCIYLTHRRPDLWEEPEKFEPARFLVKRPGSHEFFPFGGGVRRCLGMAFALYEMKIVVAQVLTRVVLGRAPGYRPRLVRRGITFAPSEGMPVVVLKKKNCGGQMEKPVAGGQP